MSKISVKELSASLQKAIADLELSEGFENTGIVIRVGDGTAWIYGLDDAAYGDMLEIELERGVVEAFALNLM